jgi:peptidyl-prolyl cis-trans isomerase C
MKPILAFVVFIAACVAAQAQGAASPSPALPASPPQARPGTVPAMPPQQGPIAHPEAVSNTEAVITVRGLCPENSGAGGAACSTVVTKEQFEKIMAAVNQAGAPMPPAAVRNLAERYVQMMAFAQQAEKLGLDKDPKFQELMRVVRLNSLSEAYRKTIDTNNSTPSDAELKAYYDKNIAKFEQVKLGRVFIPRINPKAPSGGLDDFEQRAQKLANEMRERAAKGESLDKLQQEAYKALGLAPPSLNTDIGTRRHGSFPPTVENDIFSLKSGEVTRVEPEPAGFQFYKLQGRDTLTLAQVKNEIIAAIHKERLDAVNKAVLDPLHTDLNETYFGPRSAGSPLTIPAPRPPQTRPGVSSPGAAAASGVNPPASPK